MTTSTFAQHSVQRSPLFFELANSLGIIGLSSHISRIFPVDPFDSSDGNALLHLPTSKTDQFRQGTTIPLAASHDTTCLVTALKTLYLRYPKNNFEPLFSKVIGSFNQSWVIQRLHSLLRTGGINSEG